MKKSTDKEIEITFGTYDSVFGMMLIASTKKGVCHAVFFEKGKEGAAVRELQKAWASASFKRSDAAAKRLGAQMFSKNKKKIPVVLKGTEFQKKVWQALVAIPRGQTRTYAEIAKKVGAPSASRAVGTACGKNSIAYIIPCHRVLASSGKLGGYRWNPARKQRILAFEALQK
ncbi:MAG: methylated-DNA--[protein]-cysteine S-methyltransferase [Patescibacteria group bacterium]